MEQFRLFIGKQNNQSHTSDSDSKDTIRCRFWLVALSSDVLFSPVSALSGIAHGRRRFIAAGKLELLVIK